MSAERKSYGELLRVSSIIVSSSVFSTLMALLRNKAAAMLLGPSGIGLISLLQSLMSWGGTLAAMGLGTVGARAVADAKARQVNTSAIYALLKLAMGVLGVVGALAYVALQLPISQLVLGEDTLRAEVAWLGLGVLCTAAAGAHSAYMRGMRRVGDQARVATLSATVSTALAISTIYVFGNEGIVGFVLLGPVVNFLFGSLYASKAHRSHAVDVSKQMVWNEWSKVWRAGLAFMVTGTIVTGSHLALRTLVKSELGISQLGLFQASWMITVAYIGFVVTAMSNDYYPRIAAIITNQGDLAGAINQQTDLILLVVTPLLLAMQALAPAALWLLYTDEFMAAEMVLRWQLLGDTLKIVSWPLGMVALAAGDSKVYMRNESLVGLGLAAFGWATLKILGLVGIGVGYFLMYAIYLPLVYAQVKKRTAFGYSEPVLISMGILFVSSFVLFFLCTMSPVVGAAVGVFVSILFAIRGMGLIWRQTHFGGLFGRLGRTCDQALSRVGL